MAFSTVVLAAPTSFAAEDCNPKKESCCGTAKTSIIKCDQTNKGSNIENNAIWGLLLMVLNIMTAGVGIVAVGGIVYGAILYTTAGDKADQIKKASGVIANVVVGLIAYILLFAVVQYLIPGGVFST